MDPISGPTTFACKRARVFITISSTTPHQTGALTILRESLLLEYVRLCGVEMRESMGIRHRSTVGTIAARWHSTHHRTSLSDLWPPRCRYPRMHLLHHASTGMASVGVLTGHWVVAGRQTVLRNALSGKRLRHHHC